MTSHGNDKFDMQYAPVQKDTLFSPEVCMNCIIYSHHLSAILKSKNTLQIFHQYTCAAHTPHIHTPFSYIHKLGLGKGE